jgi:hypothetical protein
LKTLKAAEQSSGASMDHLDGNIARTAMYSRNRLKLGLFGANCSSGRAVTRVPERWSGSWADCLALARMADEAGIEFMLPIGRWKGYGGETDYQGATFETVTWACGLRPARANAATDRIWHGARAADRTIDRGQAVRHCRSHR